MKKRFADFVTLQRGFDLPKTDMRDGPFPVVGSTSIIGYHDEYKVEPPGVVTGRSGSLGIVQFLNQRYWPHNTSLWVKDFKGNDPRFVYYRLQAFDFARFNAGAGVPTLNRNHLDTLEVDVPPLPVQRRIAGILSAYDELMKNSQRRIRLLEAMARALYREWFVHFRFPGQEKLPRVASPLGDVPQGWEVTELAKVCADDKGIQTGPFGSQLHEADYSDEGVPVVMPKDLIGFRIRTDSIARIPEATADKLSRHRMQPGDIVYGRRGDIGRRAFVMSHQTGWFCGTGCLRIRPNPRLVDGWFLFNYLGQDDVVGLIQGRAQGVTMPNLNTGVLSSVPVRLPPRKLQDDFARLTFPMAQAHEALTAKIENLRRTRDLLLPRLLSGQVNLTTN
jgi:type I restriction enzyme, S subunit